MVKERGKIVCIITLLRNAEEGASILELNFVLIRYACFDYFIGFHD